MNSHLLRFNKDKQLVILDLETFNLCLSFLHNRPWQCAMMAIKGEEILFTQDIYIKWKDCDLKISPEAARVTKYNQDFFNLKAIDSDLAFEQIHETIKSCDKIIMHNGIGFDLYILRDWYISKGLKWDFILEKTIDTNAVARGVKLNIPYKQDENFVEWQYRALSRVQKGVKTSLTSLGKEFKIDHDYENLHNAVIDIDLNRKVWNVLKYKIEI